MRYKDKGCCDGCNEYTWVRGDKILGVVCKDCDEPTVSFFKDKKNKKDKFSYESLELYPRRRKAV